MFDSAYFSQTVTFVLPKLVAGFLMMIAYIHLSGKGSFAPISAIDRVGNVALGAIIGGTLFNTNETVPGLIAVTGFWSGMLLLLRYFVNRHIKLKDMIDGDAIQLMKDGQILSANFEQARLSIRDFVMLLHQRGYSNLNELKNAWLEYDGQLTVIKKGEESTATVVIENGEPNRKNLARLDRDEAWLQAELDRQGVSLKNIFCAEWHGGKLWIYPFEPKQLAEGLDGGGSR